MIQLLLVLLLQSSADSAEDRCYAAASTQFDLSKCAGASLEASDSALKSFIGSYEPRLTPEQLLLFRLAQSNWQLFRRSSCEFEASGVLGGSAYPMVFAQCMASKAQARLNELKSLANCQEGDLSCPSFTRVAPNNSFKPKPLRGSA